jgi:hypothetical protein
MAEEMKFDKQHGLEGMYTEVYTFLPHTAPMIWAFAKLQWDASLDIDDLLNDFYTKMFGAGAADMQKYFSLLENCWNEDKPGFDRRVLGNIIQQALVMTPDNVQQCFDLLDAAAAKAQLPIEKKRIDIIRAALQYYSYMPLEFDVTAQLTQMPFNTTADAQKGLELATRLGQLIKEREQFWPAAMQRKDLLGANLRGFDSGRRGILHDMSPIENPVIPTLLHLTDWYRKNQPAQAAQIAEQIKSTFPEGTIRNTLADWNWVADHQPASLVKNGDFESKAANTTTAAAADWTTKGIPDGWASWSRYHAATIGAAIGRNGGNAVRIHVPEDRHDSGIVLQNINKLKPGARFLASVWVKVAPGRSPSGVSLGFRLRNNNAWYVPQNGNSGTKTVAQSADWQQLIVAITLPQDADGVSVQLNTSNSEAVFDDVALYEIPADGF